MNTKLTTKSPTLLHQNSDEASCSKALIELSERELLLLCHLHTDPTNMELADKMFITPKSVENYKTRIGDKLGLKGAHALFRFVLKNLDYFKRLSAIINANCPKGRETANSQQPTANSQQPTANSQQPTANSQQPTANSQQPTANSQQPTANSQQPQNHLIKKIKIEGFSPYQLSF